MSAFLNPKNYDWLQLTRHSNDSLLIGVI